MDKNTLVTHKHLSSLGIGVISRTLKRGVEVQFGENHRCKLRLEDIKAVDVSQTKTISFADWKSGRSVKMKYVITGNHLQRWNGIGWIFERSIRHDDLMKYMRVI